MERDHLDAGTDGPGRLRVDRLHECEPLSRRRLADTGTDGPANGTAAGWQSVLQPAANPVSLEAVSASTDGFAMVVGYDESFNAITPYAEAAPGR